MQRVYMCSRSPCPAKAAPLLLKQDALYLRPAYHWSSASGIIIDLAQSHAPKA